MGNGFKEVAHLRTNKVLYDENYSGIDWGNDMALTENNDHEDVINREFEDGEENKDKEEKNERD